MANETLTDGMIRRLPVPEKGSKITYDSILPGFGIRVTAGNARAFVLNYRTKGGRERRFTLGAFGIWSTADARKKAKQLRRLIDDGGDPMADLEAEREAPTMDALCARFILEHLPRKRASTQDDYRRILDKHILPFFGRHTKVAAVSFSDVDRLHRRVSSVGGPYVANRTLAVLSKAFSLAARWGMYTGPNPAKGVEKNKEHARKRYLIGDELARLIAALATRQGDDKQAADVIRVLLLTGCRRGEALAMRWADVDLAAGTWVKPAAVVKTGHAHSVPLSAPARQLLSDIRARQSIGRRVLGEWIFPAASGDGHRLSINRAWRQICKEAKIEGLRLHDLRHSFASELVSSGASLPLIGALLGHSNVNTTSRYSHLYSDPLRAAVEAVGRVVAAAGTTGKPTAVVTTLKPRGRRP